MAGTDRQTLFSGTEAPPPHLALDAEQLGAYLAPRVEGLGRIVQIEKFKGGQSNPTYRLTGEQGSCVLRRKPPGKLLASAHAIDREFNVMSALTRVGYPVPRPRHYCEDESIIGSAFYIVDYCPGRVYWNAEMRGMNNADRTLAYDAMNAALAELHRVDYRAIGLGGLGRSGDYCARNLARWTKVYRESKLVEIPDMELLAAALPERLPKQESTVLLHGDFGLYNIIFDPERPTINAVLDWEMSTLGDPFVDLAHHCRAWWDIPDPERGSVTSLRDHDIASLGIPDMDSYIAHYCKRMGVSEVPYRRFYFGYAQFRNAAMIQGILKRYAAGTASSGTTVHHQDRVFALAALARQTLGI
jgi:aminoglycoside phosphotransferase (APT) family kinase protein